MVRMRVGNLIVIGLDAKALARLGSGTPLLVSGSDVDIPYRLAIMFAETNEELVRELRDNGGLGDAMPALRPLRPGEPTCQGDGMTTEIKQHNLGTYLAAKGGIPQTPPSTCSTCGTLGSVIEHPEGRTPKPGEWCICTVCGTANRFDEQMQMVKASEEEISQLPERARTLIQGARDQVLSSQMSTSRGPRGQA